LLQAKHPDDAACMAFTGADIKAGDHITWAPGQPPRRSSYDEVANAPLLVFCVVLRPLRPDEVEAMGLAESEDWFWAMAGTGASPPEVVPASLVYSVSTPAKVDAEGLAEYFGQ